MRRMLLERVKLNLDGTLGRNEMDGRKSMSDALKYQQEERSKYNEKKTPE